MCRALARQVTFVHQHEGMEGAKKLDGTTDTVTMDEDEDDEDEDDFSEKEQEKEKDKQAIVTSGLLREYMHGSISHSCPSMSLHTLTKRT